MFCRSSAAGTVRGCASGLEHGFKASVHLFFLNKLAALGCRYSFFHGGKETGFFLKISCNDIRHQALGGGPGFRGDLRKVRFLLRSEMYFHALQDTAKAALGQRY
jgi:hypothetical protein